MARKEKATEAANLQLSGSKDNKNICIRATIDRQEVLNFKTLCV